MLPLGVAGKSVTSKVMAGEQGTEMSQSALKGFDDGSALQLDEGDAGTTKEAVTGGGWRSSSSWAKWLGGEAGTDWDGWLLTVSSQIGQIMLTLPNAFAQTGLIAGVVLTVCCGTISLWTMYQLISLYMERKQRMVKAGTWFNQVGPDGKGEHRTIVTQYHTVIGFFLGRWAEIIVCILVITNLVGTNVSQIVASASDVYYWDKSLDKRTWALIFGGAFQIFTFLPGLRHFRVLNILAIIGTTFTVWFIVVSAAKHGTAPGAATKPPPTRQAFYTGTAVIYNALGGHVMALEIMDSMFTPKRYRWIYFFSYLYIFTLTLPHSIAVQLAFPDRSLKSGNVYGVLPHNAYLKTSIFLMLIHQAIAFALYFMPLCFIWEKIIGVHTKSRWIRIPSRLPISLGVWVLALAFPFYGTLNSLIGAIASPGIAYIFPCLAYMWVYRTKEARANMALKPPRFLIRLGFGTFGFIFALNTFIVLCWLINGTGFSLYYSIRTFINQIQLFSVFSPCYQC